MIEYFDLIEFYSPNYLILTFMEIADEIEKILENDITNKVINIVNKKTQEASNNLTNSQYVIGFSEHPSQVLIF